MSKNESFEKYANFDHKEATLPLHEHEKVIKGDVNFGSFSSVIEVDNGTKVAKINRLLKFSPAQSVTQLTDITTMDSDINYLVEKSNEPDISKRVEIDRYAVAEKMRDLAELKKSTYSQLSKHIADHLPQVFGYAVVDSPRRDLEQRFHQRLTPNEIKQIPEHEIALMEITENVTANNALSVLGYRKLLELYTDENFVQQLKQFANGLVSLIREDGIIVDLCDSKGIRAVDNTSHPVKFESIDDFIALLQFSKKNVIAYPRNTVYTDGKIKFFDYYPVEKVEDYTSDKNFIENTIEAIKQNKYEDLYTLAKGPENRTQLIQYLVLLKYMGADF